MWNEYFPIYRDEVKVARAKGCRTLEEALQTHRNEVVFLVIKADQQKLRVMSKADAQGQALLHGAVVESVSAHTTCFPPPSVFKEQSPPVAPKVTPKP